MMSGSNTLLQVLMNRNTVAYELLQMYYSATDVDEL